MRFVNEYNENTILNLAREAMSLRLKRQQRRAWRLHAAQMRLQELERENTKLVEMIGGAVITLE